MAKKHFSFLDEAGLTVLLIIRRASDNYYWNGSDWQAAAATVAMTENTDMALDYSEYYSTTAPNSPCWWWAKGSSSDVRNSGQFTGVGTTAQVAASDTGYVVFSDAYNEVVTDTDNLVGATEAKRLINESLRIVANDRPWDWVINPGFYELTLVADTKEYTMPIYVQHIIGAYSSTARAFTIIPYTHYGQINFNNRVSGTPRKLFLFGGNVIIPDPYPSAAGTINILYKKNHHLVDDADSFPCNRDFSDCIKMLAKQRAAERKGKKELADSFRFSYKEMLHNLRISQVSSEIFVPGEPGYNL